MLINCFYFFIPIKFTWCLISLVISKLDFCLGVHGQELKNIYSAPGESLLQHIDFRLKLIKDTKTGLHLFNYIYLNI